MKPEETVVAPSSQKPVNPILEARRKEAEKRQAQHAALTLEQRLAKLDAKFGKGQGAFKERRRIQQQIEDRKTAKNTAETKQIQEENVKLLKEVLTPAKKGFTPPNGPAVPKLKARFQ